MLSYIVFSLHEYLGRGGGTVDTQRSERCHRKVVGVQLSSSAQLFTNQLNTLRSFRLTWNLLLEDNFLPTNHRLQNHS